MHHYDPYGTSFEINVLLDVAAADVNTVDHDTPAPGQTGVILDNHTLTPGELTGKLLYCAVPGDANETLRLGRIFANGADTVYFTDEGTFTVADALDNGYGFLVIDAETGSNVVGSGSWSAAPFYEPFLFVTIFEAEGHGLDNPVGNWLRPDDNNEVWYKIIGYGTDTLLVAGDVSGAAGIFDDFTVAPYPFNAPPPALTLSGQWSDNPTETTGETTFKDDHANFQSYMVGWQVMVDLMRPVLLTITDVPTSSELVVQGDMTSLSAKGGVYLLSAPPGIDPATGTLATDDSGDVTWDVLGLGTKYLWAHYRHLPAMAGFTVVGTGTVGKQAGANLTGTYNCWNRIYDPTTGRWTTPDPAATPWSNLWDYAGGGPVQKADPTGLYPITVVRQINVLIDELSFEAQETRKVTPVPGITVNVELMDCDCCTDKTRIDKAVHDMHRVLVQAWGASWQIQSDRKAGGRGWEQFRKGSSERSLLEVFDFWGWKTAAGDETTEMINTLVQYLDAMVSRLQSQSLKIRCEDGGDCDKYSGWVLPGGIGPNSKILHICCDSFNKFSPDQITSLLIHELSHSVLNTAHDEDDLKARVLSADGWGDLGNPRLFPQKE